MATKVVSLKRNDFSAVYNKGRSKANRLLIMYLLPNDAISDKRIGISVSKKVGNSVVRSRVKRLIKEAYRLNGHQMSKQLDMVIIARNTAKDASYQEIESAFLHLCKINHILVL